KADPVVLPLPPGETAAWRVRKAPWWLDARIDGNVLVLQVRHCGRLAGKILLAGPEGPVAIPVHSHLYPRTNQALRRTLAGLLSTGLAGYCVETGWTVGWSLCMADWRTSIGLPQMLRVLVGEFLGFGIAGLVWALAVGWA